MSASVLHVSFGDDFYEIIIRGNIIVKITKYCGTSQFAREVSFEDLRDEVKLDILGQIYDR